MKTAEKIWRKILFWLFLCEETTTPQGLLIQISRIPIENIASPYLFERMKLKNLSTIE